MRSSETEGIRGERGLLIKPTIHSPYISESLSNDSSGPPREQRQVNSVDSVSFLSEQPAHLLSVSDMAGAVF